MPRRKLKHFAEMKQWAHVIEPTMSLKDRDPMSSRSLSALVSTTTLKGIWGKNVILELGCGSGDYSLALAQAFPDKTVVGVDIKGSRLWHGAKRSLELGFPNLRFLRIRIENLADFFEEAELDEIWLPFPDPHPSRGNERRRLTSPRFLRIYKHLLKPRGLLHLKTDNEALFRYSLEILPGEGFKVEKAVWDLYGGLSGGVSEGVSERAITLENALFAKTQTLYEKKYLKEGRTIRYLKARKI